MYSILSNCLFIPNNYTACRRLKNKVKCDEWAWLGKVFILDSMSCRVVAPLSVVRCREAGLV